jgi:hypothetical protein
MNEILVLADGAKTPVGASRSADTLKLRTVGKDPNIRLHVDAFRTKFLSDLPERCDDLIRLATFVYSADTRIPRGTEKDVFGAKWSRQFRMVLPVRDLAFWDDAATKELLTSTLNFLTGDEFIFEFVNRSEKESAQPYFQFQDASDTSPVDVVIPFSGGADSLAAVLIALAEKRKPILVSHRAAPKIDKRQKDLVSLLKGLYNDWTFPHLSLWVHRVTGERAVEYTQRSRSFLFTSLSVVAAAMLNIDEVRLCDNGIVSINLPQSGQNLGTLLSRSTHPRYLSLAQTLMRAVTSREQFSIKNSLLFKTKKEVVEVIASSGHPELLQETVSCAHVEGTTKLQPHCGVCTQCIDRRFASVAAGMTNHDLVSRYKIDVFLNALKDGSDRTHAENYVRFAAKLEQLPNSDAFFEAFPELFECLPSDNDIEGFAGALWNLFQRHYRTTNEVLEKQIESHVQDIRRASLPVDCLLRIVVSGQQNIDARIRYIERLRDLISKSVPASFQTQPAKNERHVQDVCETAFIAAQDRLQRESPQIPFGVVTTKPDFASVPSGTTPLFVEFKFVKARTRLNHIVTEMTSRITIYKRQGAWILFVVYDPKRIIVDDDKFRDEIQEDEGVWLGIIR